MILRRFNNISVMPRLRKSRFIISEIVKARHGFEPRAFFSSSQELNHQTTVPKYCKCHDVNFRVMYFNVVILCLPFLTMFILHVVFLWRDDINNVLKLKPKTIFVYKEIKYV